LAANFGSYPLYSWFKKNPNFPRYIAPEFLQYLNERPNLTSEKKNGG
jgi:hypothetical protein